MKQPSLFDFTYPQHENPVPAKMDTVRERAAVYGVAPLSNEDLVSLLVGETEAQPVLALIQSYQKQGLTHLAGKSVEELEYTAVKRNTALTILAALELGKRITKEKLKQEQEDWSSPEAIAAFVMEDMRHLPQETFRAAYLNTKNGLIAIKTLSTGTLDRSVADSREVLRWALFYNAASIVLLHNHPSGDPEPSYEDKAVTQFIQTAATQIAIPVLDHIVIGDGRYVSFCKQGLI